MASGTLPLDSSTHRIEVIALATPEDYGWIHDVRGVVAVEVNGFQGSRSEVLARVESMEVAHPIG